MKNFPRAVGCMSVVMYEASVGGQKFNFIPLGK